MSDRQSKRSDPGFLALILDRDVAHYTARRIDELLTLFGEAYGLEDVDRQKAAEAEATSHPAYDQAGWSTVQGARGDYEQVGRKLSKTEIFDQLAAKVKAHCGFWQHDGYRYWFHQQDPNVIDRRRV